MELIEKDALKDITVMESPIFGLLMKFENGRADIDETTNAIINSVEEDIREEIRKAPTIDAIPIEWLEEYATNLANKEKANCYAFRGYKDGALWIRSMIRAWRDECSDRK